MKKCLNFGFLFLVQQDLVWACGSAMKSGAPFFGPSADYVLLGILFLIPVIIFYVFSFLEMFYYQNAGLPLKTWKGTGILTACKIVGLGCALIPRMNLI